MNLYELQAKYKKSLELADKTVAQERSKPNHPTGLYMSTAARSALYNVILADLNEIIVALEQKQTETRNKIKTIDWAAPFGNITEAEKASKFHNGKAVAYDEMLGRKPR